MIYLHLDHEGISGICEKEFSIVEILMRSANENSHRISKIERIHSLIPSFLRNLVRERYHLLIREFSRNLEGELDLCVASFDHAQTLSRRGSPVKDYSPVTCKASGSLLSRAIVAPYAGMPLAGCPPQIAP